MIFFQKSNQIKKKEIGKKKTRFGFLGFFLMSARSTTQPVGRPQSSFHDRPPPLRVTAPHVIPTPVPREQQALATNEPDVSEPSVADLSVSDAEEESSMIGSSSGTGSSSNSASGAPFLVVITGSGNGGESGESRESRESRES